MPAILSYRQLINGVVALMSTGWPEQSRGPPVPGI